MKEKLNLKFRVKSDKIIDDEICFRRNSSAAENNNAFNHRNGDRLH